MPEPTMLRFVQILPEVSILGDFLLQDLPGSGRRIDVLCRDLAACFEWGVKSWNKSNLEMIAVIGNTKILTFRNPHDQAPHGEVGWAWVVRESLRGKPPIYVQVSDGTLEEVVRHLIQDTDSKLWVLDEGGGSLSDCQSCFHTTQNSFMLGDHRGFDSQSLAVISQFDIQRISLGKKSYLSSHALAAIISEFERKVR